MHNYFNIIHFSSLVETLNTLNIVERKIRIGSFTLQLFFFTSKPIGPAVSSIFEIISFAEHLDVNLVSLFTSP
jgi:aromatic ring-cleaving dioxygenase